MTPSELKDAFREMVRDQVEPYLWSDAEIYRYMNRAQNDLCRLVGGISDSRSGATYIRMAENVAYYPISQKILKVVAVYRDDTGEALQLLNEETLYAKGRTLRDPVGKPRSVVVGMDQDYVRLDPVPDAAESGLHLRMHVYRLPLNDIDSQGNCGALELHEQHHIHLLAGIAAQAYRKQDAETFDITRANTFADEFAAYCSQCKRERERREHTPRTITYGGL